MKLIPGPALSGALCGPIGSLRFRPRGRHASVQLPRNVLAAPSADQAARRAAMTLTRALYCALPPRYPPAWKDYGEGQGYSGYAGYVAQAFPPLLATGLARLTPPNPAYTPISELAWSQGGPRQLRADWTYGGPAFQCYASAYSRILGGGAYACASVADAITSYRILDNLEPTLEYDVALVPHTVDLASIGESQHALLSPLAVAPEDYQSYTVNDPLSYFTIAQHALATAGIPRNHTAWVVYDKVSGLFPVGSSFNFSGRLSTPAGADGILSLWAVTNVLQDSAYWIAHSSQALSVRGARSPNKIVFKLRNSENATEALSVNNYNLDQTYYFWVQRASETSVTCKIYTGAGHTGYQQTLTVAVASGRRFRYLFPAVSYNSGSAGYPGYGSVYQMDYAPA